ncbi:hypothetical protein A2V71_04265 [Candidatus Berkelbacteria bacterium RBG_13_40_8]|uniref:Prepilin peptidase n=1 Tax=Candidatus Berkelbacteria bacterium RBG_13_40_8 TaxID=1797467 RepID=A0A1F5DNJ5_9BACT|nr:MAG: hypothetical protein A2V71_04265 [Candidatus Berkelbacteria bacterium RBG_13_40_8]
MNIATICNYIIAVLLGLAVGSLLNVIIFRFDDLKSILTTRSHCPKCKRQLTWYELIPFFSYLVLWGKCRTCKKPISIQYPLVEVGTGLIFALLFWKFGFSWELIPYVLISSILIIIFVYDILHYLIADILVWIAIGIWVIWLAVDYLVIGHQLSVISNSIYGGLGLGGFLAILVVASREKWMGAGDIKLGFLLGAMISWPNVLVGGFAAFSLGSIVGLVLIGVRKKTMKDRVPFAPFLIAGMFLALFLGDKLMNWYLEGLGL